MYVETLRKRDVPTNKQSEFLEMMQQDTERLGNLINSILYLSSLENQKLSRTVQRDYNVFEVDSLLRNIISELQTEFKLNEDILRLKGNAECECVIDRDWLKVVMSNLIDNALKYSIKSPKIIISPR